MQDISRHSLSDLKLKKDFKPDIIFIDYLNICASVRYKGAIVNSYTYVKAIAEEARGLAVEVGVPIVSATRPLVVVMAIVIQILPILLSLLVYLPLLFMFATYLY